MKTQKPKNSHIVSNCEDPAMPDGVFSPFIMNGAVSMTEGESAVPVVILTVWPPNRLFWCPVFAVTRAMLKCEKEKE